MSDYDRSKYYGKKKFPPRDANTFGSRFFNSKSSYSKSDRDFSKDSDKGEKVKSIKQPTILLKARDPIEERSVSPKQLSKENDSTPVTIITATPDSAPVPCLKEMTKCCKLLDEGSIYAENVQDYLQENNDFLVVGVVGAQGVGKSTILSLLARANVPNRYKRTLFNYTELSRDPESLETVKILSDNLTNVKLKDDDDLDIIFKPQDVTSVENNRNMTSGLDFFITDNRVMLLDCQPFLSGAILDELIQSENKRSNVVTEFLPLENSGEIQGLQLTALLISVCHVLILVQDSFLDSNIARFIQCAEMLKPTISNPEDEIIDHFPHLILLQNKAKMDDFSPKKFKLMQQTYKSIFSKSKMHIESGIGLGSGRIVNNLSSENCGEPINLYLIPEHNEKFETVYNGHPSIEELVKSLRSNILSATKYPLTHIQLTEKTWLTYCSKVWDHVRKSSFFVEYTKLMP